MLAVIDANSLTGCAPFADIVIFVSQMMCGMME